jgi:hypothetical protein
MPYDADLRYYETDDMAPDCFGDFQPGTVCDLCPFAGDCE